MQNLNNEMRFANEVVFCLKQLRAERTSLETHLAQVKDQIWAVKQQEWQRLKDESLEAKRKKTVMSQSLQDNYWENRAQDMMKDIFTGISQRQSEIGLRILIDAGIVNGSAKWTAEKLAALQSAFLKMKGIDIVALILRGQGLQYKLIVIALGVTEKRASFMVRRAQEVLRSTPTVRGTRW